jgi:hypothetical protein
MKVSVNHYRDEVAKIKAAGKYLDHQLDEAICNPEGEDRHYVLFQGEP